LLIHLSWTSPTFLSLEVIGWPERKGNLELAFLNSKMKLVISEKNNCFAISLRKKEHIAEQESEGIKRILYL